MDNANKLAILIDAENISPQYVNVILDEAANIGNIIYKRIYGNWTSPQMAAWKSVILENAIQPIQQFNNASGKNASDSALIIDAMDLLYQAGLDGFVIVSSDSDFTRLASRLRESGKYVLGMGNSQTPVSFISACHKFLYLDVLYADSQKTEEETETHPAEQEGSASHASQEPRKNGKNLKKIKRILIQLAEENSSENGWISSSLLGTLLFRRLPDFDPRLFGCKKFTQFIQSTDLFKMQTSGETGSGRNKDARNYFFKLK